VYDVVLLRLRLRVPSNADFIQFDNAFLTSQFPDLCTQYNDNFLALLYSVAPSTPYDHNIAYDALHNPVTVQTASFRTCTPVVQQPCPNGSADLVGTGFDPANDASTGWLTTAAPVIAGEVIELQIYIFDASDHQYDSTVLLDNLTWHVIPQAPVSAVGDLPGAGASLRATPNPFNPSTRLTFAVPQAGHVALVVFDIAGRRVATLVDEVLAAGDHQVTWSGRGDDGQVQPSGVYYARVVGSGLSETAAVVLMK
jgi:hypothetical protein